MHQPPVQTAPPTTLLVFLLMQWQGTRKKVLHFIEHQNAVEQAARVSAAAAASSNIPNCNWEKMGLAYFIQ
jgi:hypothetical protein